MKYHILADFGSTFTKAALVSETEASVIYSTKRPSTVKEDASIALDACLAEISEKFGEDVVASAKYHATSSAAGGLRMAVIGVTDRLSLAAGKNVAFGAGAKITHLFSGKLRTEQGAEYAASPLEILLLCGGYERGNQSVLLHNARILADSDLQCPIVYGGNSEVATEVRAILLQGGKECFVVPNIIPNVGLLDTAACEAIIRDLFMKRIVNMKGLGRIKERFGDIIPTPAAVLEAGKLFSEGTATHRGHEKLMIVDIGGATTDIHSYAEHIAGEGAKIIGAAEPYARRTVEGDLGMRESSDTLIAELGFEKAAMEAGVTATELAAGIQERITNTGIVADNDGEKAIDEMIASAAARIAARRHVGRWEPVHGSNCKKIQTGKNLQDVDLIIGTGGPIINSRDPQKILQEVLRKAKGDEYLLLPKKGSFYLDEDYILYAVGLLSYEDPDFAFEVMENSILTHQL